MALTYYLQHIKRGRKYPKIQIFENTPECPFSFFSHFSLFFFFCCIIMDDTNLTTSVYFCFNFFFFFAVVCIPLLKKEIGTILCKFATGPEMRRVKAKIQTFVHPSRMAESGRRLR